MKKAVLTMLAAMLAAGAFAFEKYMFRVPDELNPKEGVKGVTTYFFARAAVSIPLRDGNWIYIVNETPKQENEGGPAQIGVPKKIVELDVVSRYLEAMKRFPSITVQIGESTFFAYRCRDMFPPQDGLFLNNCYQGLVVSMGSEYSISLFLPKGRGFDDEVRGILKRVTFVPCPGTAVESALKLYGPGSRLPAASRLPVVKKMVERRGECCELIELLSTLTDDATTKAWCAKRLKKLNPGKYAADARESIPYYDYRDKAQQKAVMEMLGASESAKSADVSVPVAALATGTTGTTGVSPVANAKTKTVTLPGGATMEMVWCPPGTFMMGTPDSEPERQSKEKLHKVTLTKGFWLGRYEVTQAQWKSVMGANPSKNKNAELPVENVTWEDCDAFCKKVGGVARFPTEAEWEYACRAGTKTAFYWGTSLNGDKANCKGDSSPYGTKENGRFVGHTTKGGAYGANPWGFCDMSGNVEEWCGDWYDLIESDVAEDPKGPDTGDFRIVRGGYWRGSADYCRSGYRGYGHPKASDDRRGFRMAMDE